MRKITSLTALSSFILLLVTIVALYIAPQGRVAYWSDWHLWGLTKTDWGNIHINLGLLFLLSILLHIYYNWKPIVSYLKNKAKQVRVFTKEFTVAVIITAVVAVGTFFLAPPFHWVMEFSDFLKDSAVRKYGEPPYGHAELSSLKTFAAKLGFDLPQATQRMKKAGIEFDGSGQSIQEIARINRMSPKQLYAALKPVESPDAVKKMPDLPPPGLGRRSLADICQEYSLKIPVVLQTLSKNGITAKTELSIKEIAAQNNKNPIDIYDIIKTLN
jgi:hypothetical protein